MGLNFVLFMFFSRMLFYVIPAPLNMWLTKVSMIRRTGTPKLIFIIIAYFVFEVFFFFYQINYFPIFLNDYFDPFIMTFKNPKTISMVNIITAYHRLMALLVFIVFITFGFVILSLFRGYACFYFHYPWKFGNFPFALDQIFRLHPYVLELWDKLHFFFLDYFLEKKVENMRFYIRDINFSREDTKWSHSANLEFIWICVPAFLLAFIAFPSAMNLFYCEQYSDPVYNISVIGNQWYWTYEYNDFNLLSIFKKQIADGHTLRLFHELTENISDTNLIGGPKNPLAVKKANFLSEIMTELNNKRFTVDSNLLITTDPRLPRLLTTDRCLVLPALVPLRLLVTSSDVIHSWAVPSFGVKMDAVPGRINQLTLNLLLTGTAWGQCSELCGVNHAFMPIEVKVLHHADWLYYIQLKIEEILEEYFFRLLKFEIGLAKEFVHAFNASKPTKAMRAEINGMFDRKLIALLNIWSWIADWEASNLLYLEK